MKAEGLIQRLKAKADAIDWKKFVPKVERYEQETKHDVIAFLQALEDELGDDARLIHVGLTSSDVVDTSFALLLKQASDEIRKGLLGVLKALWKQASNNRGVRCLGRTHGQAAEPTSFGIKLLGHLCELMRGYESFNAASSAIAVGKFSGAIGVYAHAHPKISERALAKLELHEEPIATQIVARDRHALFFSSLSVLGGSIERLALEIRLLMHGQIQEAFEPFSNKQKGSSAMPHKKNPILSENLCGLMRMIRTYALAAFEDQALWHERDISHSSVERIIAPDATSIMDFALSRLLALIEGLVVDKERMEKNLADACDVLSSQGFMLALVKKGLRRQEAYEIVQKAALSSKPNDFLSTIMVLGHLSDKECQAIIEETQHIAHEDLLFERVRRLMDEQGI
jgi:adenylosuccinate lyase